MQLARTKEWRESRGFTQRELAAEAGISEVTVARLETGHSSTPPTARKIADALGVSVADLLERPPVPLVEAPPSEAAGPLDELDELLHRARVLKAEWKRLGDYDRVTGLSRGDYLATMRRMEEIEDELRRIKQRVEELRPPLCQITYYDPSGAKPPKVEFFRTPTPEEEADLREKHGDYEVENVFELAAS
jgi:transcriptional regulator with XRE-family HTH domain